MTTQTADNLKQVSGIFFLVFAFAYLGAYLCGVNQFQTETMQVVVNFVDLPTYLAGIIFLTASAVKALGYTSEEHAHKSFALWIFAGALFAGVTILDLFADQIRF